MLKFKNKLLYTINNSFSVLYIKMFIEWVSTPFALIMFFLFVPVNLMLFIIYIPLLYICILYWICRMFYYSINTSVLEVKPYKNFLHPNTTFTTYTYYLKAQTFYKAYLMSFLLVYKMFKFYGSLGRSTHFSWLSAIKSGSKILFWLLIRVITSLPRAVIVDSYECSALFIIYNSTFKETLRRKFPFKDFLSTRVTARFNTNVIFYLNDTLVPIMNRRVFKTSLNKYNFNPTSKE